MAEKSGNTSLVATSFEQDKAFFDVFKGMVAFSFKAAAAMSPTGRLASFAQNMSEMTAKNEKQPEKTQDYNNTQPQSQNQNGQTVKVETAYPWVARKHTI